MQWLMFWKKNRIPFREFIVKKSNEETIGELFAYYILETAIIGKLTNINPFDQPAVEEIKVLTKKILSKSTKNYLWTTITFFKFIF